MRFLFLRSRPSCASSSLRTLPLRNDSVYMVFSVSRSRSLPRPPGAAEDDDDDDDDDDEVP